MMSESEPSKLSDAIAERDAEQIRALILAKEFVLLCVAESDDEDDESVGALTAEVGDFDVLVAFTSEQNAGIFVGEMGDLFEDDESVDGVVIEGDAMLQYLPQDCGILLDPETEEASVIDPALAAALLGTGE